MKRLLLLFLVCSTLAQAQESYFEYDGEIGLFNTAFNSKTVLNSGGFWNDAFKTKLINKMEDVAHLHFIGTDNFRYHHKNGWSLGYAHKTFLFSTLSTDLAKVGLFGNAPYAGEQLNFAPSFTESYRYSEMELGYQWNEHLFITASALVGHQFASFQLTQGDFFTEENASYIDYNLQLEAHFSDSTLANVFDANGYGAALGLHYSKTTDGNTLQLSATDIGFIRWDEGCTNLYLDTSYHFEGLEVTDLLDFNAELLQDELDNLEGSINKPTQESYTWKIPVRLAGHYYQALSRNYFSGISIGAEHRLGIYPAPLVYANLHLKRKKSNWSFGYHYGGMERAGIQFSYGIQCKNTHFRLYTKQANLLLPEEIYGLHIGFAVKKVFLSKN